jgi:MFS family permease
VRGGWLASANYAGYLLGGLTAIGWRWSARTAIRTGLAAVALATLGMALPVGIAGWLALRAVAGVASAWVLVFTSAAVLHRIDRAPARERAALPGILYAGVGTGVAIAGILCALALMAPDPATDAWIAMGVLASVTAWMLWNRLAEPVATSHEQPSASAVLAPRTLALAACYAAFGFGYIIPATFLSAMAREAAHGGASYTLTWPLFGVAAAASTVLVTRIAGHRTARATWIAGHLVMAAGVAIAAVSAGLMAVMTCGLLVGGTFMVVTMAGMQDARREAGVHARPVLALMTSTFALGQIAGPLLVSALAAHGHGYASALWGAAAALAASALVLQILPRREPT